MIGLFTVLFILTSLSQFARAQDNAFTIRGVSVDITADNAVKAREEAFASAQIQAFKRLTDRILSDSEKQTFQMPPVADISPLVDEFEITSEQLSAVRYVATYNFNFKSAAVRNFIKSQNVTYSDVRSKPVLVLPFFQNGSQMVLWQGQNPWRDAWAQSNTFDGLVPVITPIGDSQDFADIPDGKAFNFNPLSMAKITMRYNAGEAMIMVAVPQNVSPADGLPQTLSINIYRTDRGRPDLLDNLTVQAGPNKATIYQDAVKRVRGALEAAWRAQTLVNTTQKNQLIADVFFRDVREWVETQRALKSVQGIQKFELISLKPGLARVRLHYQGGENRLRLALSQSSITLSAPQIQFDQMPQNFNVSHMNRQNVPMRYELYLDQFRY
jgi:hypothetical protein